ncbi:DUF3465 domain-containing protein [Cognatilysobacter lacus]|uniref:DUF3465 domain-containing protein n=1 Tax=Cognatilysobacter lacus TaxID=1643323 RepID=A0A5D8YT39_9GAMM|nr:DUF3465 domain-containing protein [Lysobacter lacus]TZF85112.1 DUF3465 domain-containing protein [Lysobacter lacus]
MPNMTLRISLVLLLPSLVACQQPASSSATATGAGVGAAQVSAPRDTITEAVRMHAHAAEVEGSGTVVRVLPDDANGSPHQRFLLALGGGTVLVAHNVELAPRLDGLAVGDTVGFRGEYVWTPKGGTLHWTHHDPHGDHPGGWLRWRGRTYE